MTSPIPSTIFDHVKRLFLIKCKLHKKTSLFWATYFSSHLYYFFEPFTFPDPFETQLIEPPFFFEPPNAPNKWGGPKGTLVITQAF